MYRMVMSLCRGSWQVNSAICGCPAGRGPHASCKHIGALCYALANFCLFGQLPEFLTCTDVKQAWNIETQADNCWTRKEILSKSSEAQPIPGTYDSQPISLRAVNPQNSTLTFVRDGLFLCYTTTAKLIPSTVYSKHDHTYCRVNLERLSEPHLTIYPVAICPFPKCS